MLRVRPGRGLDPWSEECRVGPTGSFLIFMSSSSWVGLPQRRYDIPRADIAIADSPNRRFFSANILSEREQLRPALAAQAVGSQLELRAPLSIAFDRALAGYLGYVGYTSLFLDSVPTALHVARRAQTRDCRGRPAVKSYHHKQHVPRRVNGEAVLLCCLLWRSLESESRPSPAAPFHRAVRSGASQQLTRPTTRPRMVSSGSWIGTRGR